MERCVRTPATGMSPITFLHHCRVLAAQKLLVNGATVTEAALGAGFNDTSQFSKAFRRVDGRSPKQWREETLG
jgi:AraC family transcriptional regulator